ncbi:MAG: response regulator [Cyanobacteria bacterium P01_G01_bin.54]
MSDWAEILVVDDTPSNLEIAIETLSAVGYEVAAVTSGERALKQLNFYHPNLILLDVQMPGIDGFETCRRIKETPLAATIPIIFMTALSDVDSKVKGFDLGAVDYITKPFQEKELLARVKTHLRLRQWSQELENCVAERTQELQAVLDRLQQSQLQLVQSEKMSALGNLVAGVAHEINNPVGFLQGNIKPAQDYVQDLFRLIDLYQEKMPNSDAEIEDEIKMIDLEFMREDLPKLIGSMSTGVDRIRNISDSLRTFSRKDQDHKVAFNIHDGIESTLLILKHRTKANEQHPKVEVVKRYSELPEVQCFPGQFNQVCMNILANAIDAFDEANQGKTYQEIEANPNQITIATSVINAQVQIQIQDNGCGMKPETVERIFEQGFTTKEVGKGTGLGMAIAHQIITEKHGGIIECHSEIGQGTTFIITLPLAGN